MIDYEGFTKAVCSLLWEAEGMDLDYCDILESGMKHGVIVLTKYDPKEHGEGADVEPGDDWYVNAWKETA